MSNHVKDPTTVKELYHHIDAHLGDVDLEERSVEYLTKLLRVVQAYEINCGAPVEVQEALSEVLAEWRVTQ